MALRAFHSNPSIGGFGNENSTTQLLGNPTILNKTTDGDSTDKNAHSDPHDSSDALCQIVKELVDNAIDACQTAQKDSSRDHTVCRVKVEILPYRSHEKSPPTLQVTVSDNGCGMKDIQACVNAFQSSKGGSSNTAGRYGIGLTLCLLHAQRLVSGTYSCITSATKEAHNFKRALFFVNTVGDSIECHREEDVEKGHATESGTCVSLLVPGGKTAEMAWKRLEQYLRRLQLGSLQCCIEVLAPTLSRVPLHIHHRMPDANIIALTKRSEVKLTEGLDSDSEEDKTSTSKVRGPCLAQRRAVLVVAQKYGCFGLPLHVQNISHSEQEIRVTGSSSKQNNMNSASNPKIIMHMIVSPHEESTTSDDSDASAHLELVRMVNSVPMLEGAESIACGLVHAVQRSMVWASFGLTLSRVTESETAHWTDNFGVRDSEQVSPYFQSHKHQLWEVHRDEISLNTDDEAFDGDERHTKRRRRSQHRALLPAKVRLGKILVIVNVVATPNVLPLPTLSKGRLPINHLPIMKALHLALRECLKSLQQTSPGLLLTTAQLRTVERDVRYIPLLANAATGILNRMQNRSRQLQLVEKVQQMRLEDDANACKQLDADILWNAREMQCTIEGRTMDSVRCMEMAKKGKKNRKKSRNANDVNHNKYTEIENSEDDGEHHCRSQEKTQPSIDVPSLSLESFLRGDYPGNKGSSNDLSEENEALLDSSPNDRCTVSCSDDEWW